MTGLDLDSKLLICLWRVKLSGYTKNKCLKEEEQAIYNLNLYIKNIIPLLPQEYDKGIILSFLETYYPHEIFLLNQKNIYYVIKEKGIRNHNKKSRFDFPKVEKMICNTKNYKLIFTVGFRNDHKLSFSQEVQEENIKKFKIKRLPKIKKTILKIEKAKQKTQEMEPEFIDKLIGLYERKTTTQKDKMYIMKELQKYYCDNVIKFFSKKNDTEINLQLREMAFKHLQSFGFDPRLRKQKYMSINIRNKKRKNYLKNVYSKEEYNISEIPEELEYRVKNSKEQLIKTYDYFISHSSLDYTLVQGLIKALNTQGKNIYCDWINDKDYLKRRLVGDATLNVIKVRMNQSKELIFVESENSLNSEWCKYELNYFKDLDKPLKYISVEKLNSKQYQLKNYCKDWFYDSDYKNISLFEENLEVLHNGT